MKKRTSFDLIDLDEKSIKGASLYLTTNYNKIFFNKLTDVISGNVLNKTIKKYNSDFRVQHFDTKSHLYSMLFFQLKGLNSLHDLQTQVSNNNKLRRLINIPSVSQLSRKNAKRDYRIFEDLYYYLVNYTYKKLGRARVEKNLPILKIIDSTMIDLPFKLAKHFRYDNKQKRAAVKISTLFNGKYPERINIVTGKVNDRKCIDGMIKNKDCIYLFDRGYYDYSWYDKLTDDGFKFITRQPSNACVEEIRSTYVDNDLIFDYEITLGTEYSKNKTHNTYREILTFNENEEEFRVLTNIFDMSPEDILLLYRIRWKIETFFKWVKQNLKIKKCIGYNDNSIKIQIYTALIAYILIYFLKESLQVKTSMLKITRIIKSNILENTGDVLEYIVDS
ncbi:IS4 family transposase [Caproiciproducens sp. MSJ-32]|uniref:IS4 family transposase n=1 Tax=Caproiciproducens sp. MSJ-32 TaxID=2841527 RepID=UPI001C105007|nr:IS4 family transposase [Caproiciproducens sp. MSJ-32]MBU5455003.1 IS4 family transposase [Caproiciproducens sp. MSJ-32]